jgi:hypothetical protein
MTESQLIKTIKAHIEKGDKAKDKAEQHYISAGQHLKQSKDDCPDQKTFLEKVEKEIGIGKSRTYELLQIGDGRKTVAEVRADTAKRTADTKDRLKLSATSGQNADDSETSAAAMKAKFAALDVPEADGIEGDGDGDGTEVTAALRMVEQMSEESREAFFGELQDRYPDDYGHPIYENDNDPSVVDTIVRAIGAERTRALAEKIPRLVLQTVGKGALPDCLWCEGAGLTDANFGGTPVKASCLCTRRKRGEDFNALQARLERENREQQIPEQDFSFGLEVTTKDGKVWASGVRLATKEEAEFYIDWWARNELRKHGYVTWDNDPNSDVRAFDIKQYDDRPMMKITGGRRKTMSFMHGTCGLLGPQGWRPISGGECECKKCKRDRERREADERLLERFNKEREIGERALAAGEISQEQYDEWMDLPCNKQPEWLARLMHTAQ